MSTNDFEEILSRFELACKEGSVPPDLTSYLGQSDDLELLVELIHIDLDYRLRRSDQVRIEDYLSKYPILDRSDESVAKLAFAEYQLREHRGYRPSSEDLLSRFPEHRERITQMLASQGKGKDSNRGLDQETVDLSLEGGDQSRWLGPYKLLDLIGQGGMGSVYSAEQQRPIRRQVAIKVIKAGMDTLRVQQRFDAEKQALALMDHPNIARVLDAGVTPKGEPYFAMELVDGIPITRYCDDHQLTVEGRLELFSQVCSAIQHAHQKGVVHRDIKPSNVLVTMVEGVPRVKVIDFGLAKAIQAETLLTERSFQTEFGLVVGTFQYMSPEQASSDTSDIDTRSDVYSLGVLLYELLTGSTPIEKERLRTMAIDAVVRAIRQEEPARPSVRLGLLGDSAKGITTQRQIEFARLQQLLKGDLDWIVMKALEKERSRRYDSVSSLAQDVRRFRDNEEVSARPPSVGYRLAKTYRRHRAALLTMAGVGLLLLGATITSLAFAYQANVAANRALRAEEDAVAEAKKSAAMGLSVVETIKDVVFEYDPLLRNIAGASSARQKVLSKFLPRLDQLSQEFSSTSIDRGRSEYQVLMSLSETVQELGGMGSESVANLKPNQTTDSKTALDLQERLIEQALAIGVKLKEQFPEDSVLDQDQLKLQNELGYIVMFRGDLERAKQLFDQAQATALQLTAKEPESAQAKRDLSLVIERQGFLKEKKGRIEEALGLYNEQLELLRSIAKDADQDDPIHRDVSVALRSIGKLHLRQKAIAEARGLLEKSLEISRRRADKFPESRREQLDLINGLDDLASVCEAEGKVDRAVEYLNESTQSMEKLIDRNPENVDLQRRYAIILGHLGDMEFRRAGLENAEAAQRKALAIRERLATRDPDNAVIQRELNVSYSNLGDVLVKNGDLNEAETLFRKGIEVVERLKNGTGTQDADLMRSLSVANNKMGFLLLKKGQNTESLVWYQRGLAVIEELSNRNPGDARTQRDLEISLTRVGDLQQQLGETQEARGYYERSLKSSLARVASNPEDVEAIKDLIASRNRMASAFALSGEIPEAIAEYHAALDLQSQLEKKTGLPDLKLTRAKLLRGLGFTAMMRPDLKSARASFEESLVILNDLRNDKKLSPNDALLMKGVQEGIDGITQIEYALGDLEEILKQSARKRKESLLVRCVEMARHGRIAESQQAIDRLRSGGYFLTPDDLYELVRAYGLIARSIVKENINLPEVQKQQHQEALHTGIETLRQAIDLGFYNLPLLKMDKDLGQFSTDPEFKKLLEALSVRPGPDGSWDALMQQPAASQPHLLKGRLEMMAAQRRPSDLIQAAGKLEELSKLAESSEEKLDGFYEAFRGYAFAIKLTAGWKGQVDFQVPETLREPTGRDAEIQAVITSAHGALQAALALGFEDYERFGSDENLSVVRQLPEFQDVVSSLKTP